MLRRMTSAKKVCEHIGRRSINRARRLHFDGIVAKVWQIEFLAQQPAIRVRVCRNATLPGGRKILKLGYQGSVGIKEFFWLVAAHPVFDNLQAMFVRNRVEHRNLMRAPEVLHLMSINFFRSSPSFR